MDAHGAEDRLVAEQAAEWLCRLRSADLEEQAAFVRWLKKSPRHVREMLIAMTWDRVLRGVDWRRKAPPSVLATLSTVVDLARDQTRPPSLC